MMYNDVPKSNVWSKHQKQLKPTTSLMAMLAMDPGVDHWPITRNDELTGESCSSSSKNLPTILPIHLCLISILGLEIWIVLLKLEQN